MIPIVKILVTVILIDINFLFCYNNIMNEVLYNQQLTQVYTDVNLTVEGEPYQVKRTWKERLFSLPWKPWKSHKTITPRIPSPYVYGFGNNMFMHPVTLDAMKKVMTDELV